jgi:hypothetical protein
MTNGQSASLSWNKTPIWGLQPDFYYCRTVADLLTWGAFSDKRMGLSFTIAAGPHQSSHSWVWVPWDSRPYFTISDSRPPFLSPPTTHRATLEVFNPTSTQVISNGSCIRPLCFILSVKRTPGSTLLLLCCTKLLPCVPYYWVVE